MSTVDLSGIRWRKSSFSGGTGGGNDNCIEVAIIDTMTTLRDSKNATGPTLVLPTAAWTALLTVNR